MDFGLLKPGDMCRENGGTAWGRSCKISISCEALICSLCLDPVTRRSCSVVHLKLFNFLMGKKLLNVSNALYLKYFMNYVFYFVFIVFGY